MLCTPQICQPESMQKKKNSKISFVSQTCGFITKFATPVLKKLHQY